MNGALSISRPQRDLLPLLTFVTLAALSYASALAQTSGGANRQCDVVSPPACPKEGSGASLPADLLSVGVVSGGEPQDNELTCGFLTGKTTQGTSWSNSAPADWCKLSMKPLPQEAGDLHRDSSLSSGGKDSKPPNGLDSGPMLVFYAGHGDLNPTTAWQAAGNSPEQQVVKLDQVLLGDGALRYFWQCSCNVMAHGEESLVDGTKDYFNPTSFYFGGNGFDNEKLRNVHRRWPVHMGGGLRMACGGTSGVCGNQQAVSERIWDNYNNKGYEVADSFLEGIFNAPSGVPLCLTRGGIKSIHTPLYDEEFSTKTNPYDPAVDGPAYIHLLYPVRFGGDSHPKAVPSSQPSGNYSVFYFRPGSFELLCQSSDHPLKSHQCISSSRAPAESRPERIDVRSGARYFSGEPIKEPVLLTGAPQQWEEGHFIDLSLDFVRRHGWLERQFRSPEGMRLVVESAADGSYGNNFVRQQKDVLVRFKRQIAIERDAGRTELVNVLGPGGEISLLLNNDGSVIRASKVWRPVAGETGAAGGPDKVVQVQARTALQALAVLQGRPDWQDQAEIYQREPAYYVWGYKEEAGNCRQKAIRLVYQFTFLPKNDDLFRGYSPLTLEVPAQALPEDDGLLQAEPCFRDTAE
ncbi:MAG TPA: hypothetical protein VLX28_06475 [Thermoanaerobaculia bacterium]|nr:hypothetical protein [Thermoanaerobaculia bacterium]